jgi:molybdate transport system substrate-binding protein
MEDPSDDAFRVMTSGVFTAAHLALIPQIEAFIGRPVLTLTTSIGTGERSIPNRLLRRETADLVIVAEPNMTNFVQAGHIATATRTLIARSIAAVAVRQGEPPPDVSTVQALRRTFLQADSIAYSASESGKYLTTQLYHRLGVEKECLPKSRFVGNGERTGAFVARGEAQLAFQQVSELRPVQGIAHITPIPHELQSYVWVATGALAWSRNLECARGGEFPGVRCGRTKNRRKRARSAVRRRPVYRDACGPRQGRLKSSASPFLF